jgi:polyphosphate glucokinase
MADTLTLAIDIGGTGLKLALLDEKGEMVGKRVRTPTPPKPVSPKLLIEKLAECAAQVPKFDRVSVGFPGAVRRGQILTAPNLGTEVWSGFDLQSALADLWKKPVRVMNDADVQGFGAIKGHGVEMVLTLGTGAGTSLFFNGQIAPHLELAHHPISGKKDYDQYVGRVALEKKGKKAWNKRVQHVLEVLRTVVNFDHLYIGGGNAKAISFELPSDITVVPNSDGLTGGIALWRAEAAATPPSGSNGASAPAPKRAKAAAPKAVTRAAPKAPRAATMRGRRPGRAGAAASAR